MTMQINIKNYGIRKKEKKKKQKIAATVTLLEKSIATCSAGLENGSEIEVEGALHFGIAGNGGPEF